MERPSQSVDSSRTFTRPQRDASVSVMISAVGYCRVSTMKQSNEGVSLQAQEAAIKKYCAENGIKLLDIFVDEGKSGKNLKRPAFQKALAEIDSRRANAIVVFKLDRMTRSLRDLFNLLDSRFDGSENHLISLCEKFDTTTAMGKAYLSLIGIIAQLERETISERVKAGIDYITENGGHFGAIPFGKQAKLNPVTGLRELEDHPVEAPIVQDTINMYRELKEKGGAIYETIASSLNERGIKPRRGKWSKYVIYNMLVRWGVIAQKPYNTEAANYSREEASKLIQELHLDGRSGVQIARILNSQGYRPAKSEKYSAMIVYGLIKRFEALDLMTPHGFAASLKKQGLSLREIASRLQTAGFLTIRGGKTWFPAQVASLLNKPDPTQLIKQTIGG